MKTSLLQWFGVVGLMLGGGCLDTLEDNPVASGQADGVWITLGSDALEYSRAPRSIPWRAHADAELAKFPDSVAVFETAGPIAVAQVSEEQIVDLSEYMHANLGRCSGFMVHDSYEDAVGSLSPAATAQAVPNVQYTIDNGAVVRALQADLNETRIINTITDLSAFETRYYTSQLGVRAIQWIRDLWIGYAGGRSDVTVELVKHPNWAQDSVVLTIKGTTRPQEVVVIGGHADSIVRASGATRAPGADDNASGIATISEVLRVAFVKGYRPARTIKAMGYAAEEVGLRGSKEIADSFARSGVNVVGVVQLDMTNYKGSVPDIVLMTDYTNAAQNDFITRLIDTYVGVPWAFDRCGYACSDHASWHRAGFAASMPFEARMGEHNKKLHTTGDTISVSGGRATHAMKFARLAAAYLAELAKGDVAR